MLHVVCCLLSVRRRSYRVEDVREHIGGFDLVIDEARGFYKQVSPVLAQMWRGEPGPGADVAGVGAALSAPPDSPGRGQRCRRLSRAGGDPTICCPTQQQKLQAPQLKLGMARCGSCKSRNGCTVAASDVASSGHADGNAVPSHRSVAVVRRGSRGPIRVCRCRLDDGLRD